jgi:hypothetical protein
MDKAEITINEPGLISIILPTRGRVTRYSRTSTTY